MHDLHDLPDALTTGLQRLASAETAGSRPFPALEAEIHRRRLEAIHHGRVALTGVAGVLVIMADVLGGGFGA